MTVKATHHNTALMSNAMPPRVPTGRAGQTSQCHRDGTTKDHRCRACWVRCMRRWRRERPRVDPGDYSSGRACMRFGPRVGVEQTTLRFQHLSQLVASGHRWLLAQDRRTRLVVLHTKSSQSPQHHRPTDNPISLNRQDNSPTITSTLQ